MAVLFFETDIELSKNTWYLGITILVTEAKGYNQYFVSIAEEKAPI